MFSINSHFVNVTLLPSVPALRQLHRFFFPDVKWTASEFHSLKSIRARSTFFFAHEIVWRTLIGLNKAFVHSSVELQFEYKVRVCCLAYDINLGLLCLMLRQLRFFEISGFHEYPQSIRRKTIPHPKLRTATSESL